MPWDADWIGETPALVFDDDCGFCTWWAQFVAERSDVRLVGYSALTPGLRDVLPADYERSSHLVTDEGVFSGGESMEEALARTDLAPEDAREVLAFLREFEDYRRLREGVYAWVRDNRSLLGRVTSAEPPARSRGEC